MAGRTPISTSPQATSPCPVILHHHHHGLHDLDFFSNLDDSQCPAENFPQGGMFHPPACCDQSLSVAVLQHSQGRRLLSAFPWLLAPPGRGWRGPRAGHLFCGSISLPWGPCPGRGAHGHAQPREGAQWSFLGRFMVLCVLEPGHGCRGASLANPWQNAGF